jgi:hypothetical protein
MTRQEGRRLGGSMASGGLRTGVPPSDSMASLLRGSLPMVLVTVVLFAAGYVLLWRGVNFGPTALPLWALLLVLGFVACVGTAVSWLFGDASDSVPRGKNVGIATEGRSPELGRPYPNVASPNRNAVSGAEVELAPWDEGPVPNSDSADLYVEAFPAGGSRPEDSGRVLEELDGIEREVAPRRKADRPSSR